MKTVVFFCVISFALGCSRNTIVTGTYSAISNPDFLQLNADSTFYYKYAAYHLSESSSGRWQKVGSNRIVLNSEFQERYLPLKVSSATKSTDGVLELKMLFEAEMPLANYKCAIFLNDTLYQPTQNNFLISTGIGIADFEKLINLDDLYQGYVRCDSLLLLKIPVMVQKLFFKVVKVPLEITTTSLIKYSLQTEKYVVPPTYGGQMEVVVSFKDFLFNYRMFRGEELRVKRDGISIFNVNKNQWWYIPKSSPTYK